MKWTKGIATLWIVGIASGIAKADWEEGEVIPADKIEKTHTLRVTMQGKWIGYFSEGASSATVIEGYKSYEDCSKAGGKLVLVLLDAGGMVGNEKWNNETMSAKWSCNPEDSIKE